MIFSCCKHVLKKKKKFVTRVIDLARSNKLILFSLNYIKKTITTYGLHLKNNNHNNLGQKYFPK
jgi:hypothetical protein